MTRPRLTAAGAIATVVVAAGCGVLGAGGGTPARLGGPRDDAVIVGGYGEILALSGSRRMLFAASEDGVAIHDRFTDRWLPPFTAADGFPATRFTTLSADPERDAVWIGALGEVVVYDPTLDQLSRAIVPGRVERIFFDREDPAAGAYVASGGGWTRVSPSGLALPVRFEELPPPGRQWRSADLDDLHREYPSLRSFATLLTRDESFRAWQPSAGTRMGDRSEAWIGTLGGGLYEVDPLFNRARHVPYGLFERGASALALSATGVWIGSDGRDLRGTGGVAATDAELQRWEWLRGPPDGTMTGVPVHEVLVVDGAIWVATPRGVARRPLASSDASARRAQWTWLPVGRTQRAWALAASREGVWIGSDQGLRFAGGDGSPGLVDAGGGSPVRALARSGDSLWVGTDAGLSLVRSAGAAGVAPERPSLAPTTNVLDRRIRALARADSVLAVATDDAVVLIDLRARSARLLARGADARALAPLAALAVDARSIWVAGARGLMVIDRASGAGRLIRTPVPSGVPIHDVVVDEEMVWLATPAGVVRLRKLMQR